MTDKEKFYKLALNIVNYPYDKAVYYQKDWIRKIIVFPDPTCEFRGIRFHNYSVIPEIELNLDGDWYSAYITQSDRIDSLIEKIKENCDEKAKDALLKGIE